MDDAGAERLVVAMFALAVEDTRAGDSSAAAWLQSSQAIHLAESLGLDANKMLANVGKLVTQHDARPRNIDNPRDLRESFELYSQGRVSYKQITRQYGRSFESIRLRWERMGFFDLDPEARKRALELHMDWWRIGGPLSEYAMAHGLVESELLELFRRNGLSTFAKPRKGAIEPGEVERQYRGWRDSGMSLTQYSRSMGYSGQTLRKRFQLFGYEVTARSNA